MNSKLSAAGAVLLLLAGCAPLPVGPSAEVMPGPGKPFDLFVREDATCRDYAGVQAGITPQHAAQNETLSGAAAGTAVGALAGTAIGAAAGHVGSGAAIGAGIGMAEGTAIGASSGYGAGWSVQRRYDVAYEQCMYAKGNQVPGFPLIYSQPPVPPPPAPVQSPPGSVRRY